MIDSCGTVQCVRPRVPHNYYIGGHTECERTGILMFASRGGHTWWPTCGYVLSSNTRVCRRTRTTPYLRNNCGTLIPRIVASCGGHRERPTCGNVLAPGARVLRRTQRAANISMDSTMAMAYHRDPPTPT